MTSLIETIRAGGCYWRREGLWKRNSRSPGHSFAIPNGTYFKIASEGPASSMFVTGKCTDGYFVPDSGSQRGARFASANEAVNTIRGHSSNAFLYIHFRIDGEWQSANDLRTSKHAELDVAEELALHQALKDGPPMSDPVLALRAAADLVAKEPERVETQRTLFDALG